MSSYASELATVVQVERGKSRLSKIRQALGLRRGAMLSLENEV